MAKQGSKKLQAVERQRRKAQSGRDKRSKAPAPPRPVRPRATKRPAQAESSVTSYARLIANPCTAKLAHSVSPTDNGNFVMRVPFRKSIALPSISGGVGIDGEHPGNTTMNHTDLVVGIFPSNAMVGNNNSAIAYYSHAGGSSYTPPPGTWPNTSFAIVDPQGLQTLCSMAGSARPIAACLKMRYVGVAGQASGSMVAYQGPLKQNWTMGNAYGSSSGATVGTLGPTSATGTRLPAPSSSYDEIFLQGKSVQSPTATAELCVNYANCDVSYTEFEDLRSGNNEPALNPAYDLTQMPYGQISVTDAVPGSRYVIEGAIIFEWVPKFGQGIQLPDITVPSPSARDKVAAILYRATKMLVSFTDGISNSNWIDKAIHKAGSYALKGAMTAAPLLLTL